MFGVKREDAEDLTAMFEAFEDSTARITGAHARKICRMLGLPVDECHPAPAFDERCFSLDAFLHLAARLIERARDVERDLARVGAGAQAARMFAVISSAEDSLSGPGLQRAVERSIDPRGEHGATPEERRLRAEQAVAVTAGATGAPSVDGRPPAFTVAEFKALLTRFYRE